MNVFCLALFAAIGIQLKKKKYCGKQIERCTYTEYFYDKKLKIVRLLWLSNENV